MSKDARKTAFGKGENPFITKILRKCNKKKLPQLNKMHLLKKSTTNIILNGK